MVKFERFSVLLVLEREQIVKIVDLVRTMERRRAPLQSLYNSVFGVEQIVHYEIKNVKVVVVRTALFRTEKSQTSVQKRSSVYSSARRFASSQVFMSRLVFVLWCRLRQNLKERG